MIYTSAARLYISLLCVKRVICLMVLVPLELREETEGGLLGGTAIKWSPIVLTLRKYIACKRGLVGDWRGGGGRERGEGVFKQVLRRSALYNSCCLL